MSSMEQNSMDGQSTVPNNGPVLCRANCGFYGSQANEGLCSKCFKVSTQKKNEGGENSVFACSSGENAAAKAQMVASIGEKDLASPSSDHKAATTTQQHSPTMCSITTTTTSTTQSPCASNKNPINNGVDQQPSLLPSAAQSSVSFDTDTASTCSHTTESQHVNTTVINAAKKRNRCEKCRKKIGLTGFECRCGGLFCSQHRYSDMHECNVDYKAIGAEQIRKNNPLVQAEKVEKI